MKGQIRRNPSWCCRRLESIQIAVICEAAQPTIIVLKSCWPENVQPKPWSPLIKEESLACQITSRFNKKIGCFLLSNLFNCILSHEKTLTH